MKLVAVYVTASSPAEARTIGRACVEEKLAACANIFDSIQSVYWWEGKIEESAEAALLLKTRTSLVPALIDKIRGIHSYSCPCIVSLPLENGNPDYLKWIGENTRE